MTVSAVFGFIYAALQAVPIFDKWVQQFYEYYVGERIKNIKEYHSTKIDKISAVLTQIDEAKTHEQKRILMDVLNDLKRM